MKITMHGGRENTLVSSIGASFAANNGI